jgi:hypothetical protein
MKTFREFRLLSESKGALYTGRYMSIDEIRNNPPKWTKSNPEPWIECMQAAYVVIKAAKGMKPFNTWPDDDEPDAQKVATYDALNRVTQIGVKKFPDGTEVGKVTWHFIVSWMAYCGWLKRDGRIDTIVTLNPEAEKDAESGGFIELL